MSELISLERKDVRIFECGGDLQVAKERVRKGDLGRMYSQRIVPLPSEAMKAITLYLEEREDNHPALFLSNKGNVINARTIQHMLQKYGICSYQLRHTYITNLVQTGMDTITIQTLLGHKTLNMTL